MTDEEQIRQTLARFCHLLDGRRFREWSELFAEDGAFVGATEHVGRPAILEWISGGELASDPELRRQHVCTNLIIDARGDEAEVVSDLILLDCVAQGDWAIRIGRYTDHLVKRDDRWFFQRRQLVMV